MSGQFVNQVINCIQIIGILLITHNKKLVQIFLKGYKIFLNGYKIFFENTVV